MLPSPIAEGTRPAGAGHSVSSDDEGAGFAAVRAALGGHPPASGDLVIVFTSVTDRDPEAVFRGAADAAFPAAVIGCTSSSAFTHDAVVPNGCVAALVPGIDMSFGICQVERDDGDIAGSAREAARQAQERAGDRHPHSVLLLLADGLTPDQREIARGAYEVATAIVPFVGGAAADDLQWAQTHTFGDGQLLSNGILAVWINSARAIGVAVDHGWRPTGKPMLVTRARGTVVDELDGMPALDAYLAEQGDGLTGTEEDFFLRVLTSPVGCPSARGRYDVRQLHAYLPEGRGINFNTGISEQSILQVMSSDQGGLIAGAQRAARAAVDGLDGPPRLLLVFSCGSRVPLLGEHVVDEINAICGDAHGAPVCGFFTFGEFAHTTGSSGVHNSSVAILAL